MTSLSQPTPQHEARLPALRQELDLLRAPRERNGAPAWTLHDPVRNKFFRIGWIEFELLIRWGDTTATALAEQVKRETRLEVSGDYVDAFVRDMKRNQLTINETKDSWKLLASVAAQKKQNTLIWLLHHYLFFRLPLFRPDGYLRVVEPWLRFLFTRGFGLVVAAALISGVYLAGRQWDVLQSRIRLLATFNNLPWFFLAVALTKALHEFGHAIVAKHHGARVPTAGIAFMVLWPMLYTDTTDAWRLTSRRARLAIDAAGVGAELVLAVFALLAWGLLPDGPLRNMALLTATFTWVATLAINLNPFMRFDGYYLLSDFVDMPNLQPRAFAMALWSIRKTIFGIDDPDPEPVTPQRRRWMIAYAVGVWLYRLFVFTAIALLVYHFFIKLVGIGLFLVEIGWFILLPVWRELQVWWKRRGDMKPTRGGVIALTATIAALLMLAVPWQTTVEAPAVVRAASYARLFPQAEGRIEHIHAARGARIRVGETLFTVRSLDTEARITIVKAKILEAERELSLTSTDRQAAGRQGVLLGEISARKRELLAEVELQDRLVIRAPIAGEFVDLGGEIHAGRWVGPETVLGVIADRRRWALTAYVGESDVERFSVGASVRFYATSPDMPAVEGRVIAMERADTRSLDDKELASPRGGPVDVNRSPSGEFHPKAALYRVNVEPLRENAPIMHSLRGTAYIAAERRSPLAGFWRTAAAVLLREATF